MSEPVIQVSAGMEERIGIVGGLPLAERVMLLLHPLAVKKTLFVRSTLFCAAEVPDSVFLLYSGMVRLSTSSHDGRSLTVRLATSGDVLGLSSLFSDRAHQMTAECVTDACVGIVNKSDLFEFLTSQPQARLPVLQLLSEEVSVYRDLIRTFVHAA